MKRIDRLIKFIFFSITPLLFISITSCEYNENDIYERDLNPNVNPPNIQTVFLDLALDRDTVELLYNRVYFNFKSSNQKIKFVHFYIDGDSVGTAMSNNGYFDLHYDRLFFGTHRLMLKLFISSGTGSIADSLNAEGFIMTTKEWVIKVKDTSYYNLTSTVSDGFLKLRWTQPYEEVSQYIIYNNGIEIGRSTTREFIVTGHVGESTTYYVKYMSQYSGLTTWGSLEIPNEMSVTFSADKSNNFYVNWGKLKYYAAVESITIKSYDAENSYLGYQIETTTNTNTTGFSIPIAYFGQVRNYKILLTPKYFNATYNPDSYYYESNFGSPYYEFVIGYPFPIYQSLMYAGNTEVIYHTDEYDFSHTSYNDTIFRYSLIENKVVDKYRRPKPSPYYSGDLYYAPTTSPNGNYFLATDILTNKVLIGPSNNLSNYKFIDLASSANISYFTKKIPVSNIGTGIVDGSDKKYLYDFINERSLGSISNSSDPWDYNLSSDGKYIFLSFWHTIYLYEYKDNTINSIGSLYGGSGDFDYFQFIPNEPSKAIAWSKESALLKIYSIPDLTVDKSFSLTEDAILDIDYQNNKILSFSSKKLVVRSLTDGTVLNEIPVSFNYEWDCKCRLIGNSIFHPNGARYYLN